MGKSMVSCFFNHRVHAILRRAFYTLRKTYNYCLKPSTA